MVQIGEEWVGGKCVDGEFRLLSELLKHLDNFLPLHYARPYPLNTAPPPLDMNNVMLLEQPRPAETEPWPPTDCPPQPPPHLHLLRLSEAMQAGFHALIDSTIKYQGKCLLILVLLLLLILLSASCVFTLGVLSGFAVFAGSGRV